MVGSDFSKYFASEYLAYLCSSNSNVVSVELAFANCLVLKFGSLKRMVFCAELAFEATCS